MQTELDDPTSLDGASVASAGGNERSGGSTPGGEPAAAATDHDGRDDPAERPSARPTWKDPVALAAAALVLLPAVAAVVSALRNPWAPVDDWALMELQVRDVGTGDTPLVGSWSRFGWEHPGPWALWLLAGFYRLVPAEHGLLFAAGMCNLVALAACVAIALRRPRLQALVVLAGLAALVRGLGVAGLGDPWNPILPIVPFALFCLACVELAIAPRRWLLAVAVGAGSLVIQAHIGFIQPVVLVAATTAGLVWWRARSDRAGPETAGGPEPAEPDAGAEPAAPADPADASLRRRARSRDLWPAALVFAVAWFPVVLDQFAGRGNIGRIVRWVGGDDLGVGPATINEGRLGPERIATSAAWLLEPFGLWIGRYAQPRAFGLDLLGTAAAIGLVWVPCALGAALVLVRRMPDQERWPTVCCAAVGGAATLAVVTDLATAKGAPVSWPFRWAAVPVMLIWITVGWALAGAIRARAGADDAIRTGAGTCVDLEADVALGARGVRAAASGRRTRAARWAGLGGMAGLAAGVAFLVGLTVWRGSVGVQPRQSVSDAMLRLTPVIEDTLRDEDVVVANSTIKLDQVDLGLPVVLDRAGIEWVERDDPRAVGEPAYSVSEARTLDGILGLMESVGQIEVVARTGPPDGQWSGADLVFLRWLPADEAVEITPEALAAFEAATRTP